MKAVELTCRVCENTCRKEVDDDVIIGPHETVKKGTGLAQRDPDDIVMRRKGYGTMPTVPCDVCGSLKHKVKRVPSEADSDA